MEVEWKNGKVARAKEWTVGGWQHVVAGKQERILIPKDFRKAAGSWQRFGDGHFGIRFGDVISALRSDSPVAFFHRRLDWYGGDRTGDQSRGLFH